MTRPRSLVWATDIDVLPADRIVRREDDHLVVRCPGNPNHWWGNFLLFDDPPGPGDGERWERAFETAFAGVPGIRHRALNWDRTDGDEGAAEGELVSRGYALERTVGLIAEPAEIRRHPRANREVEIRALDPGGDAALWEAALAVQIANNDADREPIPDHEAFARGRQAELRELFTGGRGAWYAAIDPSDGAVVAGCGVVATGPRGRFQQVDTHPCHRRRGIATRLVAHAGIDAARRHRLRTLVIAADADYHALGIYESLGFRRVERMCGALRQPPRDV